MHENKTIIQRCAEVEDKSRKILRCKRTNLRKRRAIVTRRGKMVAGELKRS